MKAVLCKSYGPPDSLVIEEVPDLKPGKNQVVIEVKAAGVNFPDTLIIQGKYQFQPEMPFSPGSEVAGVVKEVGEGATRFKRGDRVIAFLGWGGFAEQVLAEEGQLTSIPEEMDFVTAASLLLAYGTSHYALKDRAKLRPGETVLVLGAAGGVGIAAVEIAKAMGARVIAAASSDEKLAFCKAHGADEVVNYSDEKWRNQVKALTGGQGVDVIYDPVGGPYAEPALRSIAWEGRYLVIGFAAGEIPKIPLNLVLLKSCDIVGVFWGAFTNRDREKHEANVREMMAWFKSGQLKIKVDKTYPLDQAAVALNDMLARRVKGKTALIP